MTKYIQERFVRFNPERDDFTKYQSMFRVEVEDNGKKIKWYYFEWVRTEWLSSHSVWEVFEVEITDVLTKTPFAGLDMDMDITELKNKNARNVFIGKMIDVIANVKSRINKIKKNSGTYTVKTPQLTRHVKYMQQHLTLKPSQVKVIKEMLTDAVIAINKTVERNDTLLIIGISTKPMAYPTGRIEFLQIKYRNDKPEKLSSNSMMQKKKSPMKKNSLIEGCRKMTGDVKQMGEQFSKNFKKLI